MKEFHRRRRAPTRCDSPKRLATRVMGGEAHLAPLGAAIALILAFILLIAFAGTLHFAGVPIVDMRL